MRAGRISTDGARKFIVTDGTTLGTPTSYRDAVYVPYSTHWQVVPKSKTGSVDVSSGINT